jgi:hypothetical protein
LSSLNILKPLSYPLKLEVHGLDVKPYVEYPLLFNISEIIVLFSDIDLNQSPYLQGQQPDRIDNTEAEVLMLGENADKKVMAFFENSSRFGVRPSVLAFSL